MNENKIVEDENREKRKKISELRSVLAAIEPKHILPQASNLPQIFEFPQTKKHNQANLGGIFISYIFIK